MELRPAFLEESIYPGRILRAAPPTHPISAPSNLLALTNNIATLLRDHSMAQLTHRPARFRRFHVSSSSVPRVLSSAPARRRLVCSQTTLTLLLVWALRIRENSSAGRQL